MLKFLPTPSRRDFLKVLGLGAAGLVVGCTAEPPTPGATSTPAHASVTPSPAAQLEQMNHFVKIGNDGQVTVVVKHSEFGQGSSTGLTAIVAEELDADWAQMNWEFAPADATRYANTQMGIQGTGGSSAIANSWQQLRQAGAGARALLVAAAAAEWKVPVEEIEVSKGTITHKSGKSSGFGALAGAAAKQKLPEKLVLKDPSKFTLIGQPLPRLDGAIKSNGQAQFAIDQNLPGMRIAVMLRPPKFGGKLDKLDDAEARALPGVFEIVTVPRGVAVIAKDFWTAQKAKRLLKATWDFSKAEKRGTPELLRDYKNQLKKPGAVARNDGKAEATFAGAAHKVELEYEFPYLAHAPMEPLGCLIDFKNGEADLYYGAQLQTVDQASAAATLGIASDKVRINSVFGGGSFGRRATPDSDYVVEACSIAKAVQEKTPIKLMWDRSDDLHGGRYRPMSVHRVRGAVGADGKASAYFHQMVVQSFLADSPFAMMIKNGVDATSVEGSANSDYLIPNFRVEVHMAKGGVSTLWWRSVGHTYNAFVMETFVDALAHAAGLDPVKFRLSLLPPKSRRRGVLDLAVAKAGTAPKGKQMGRGVAVHESFGSYVAQVVDVEVKEGKPVVQRVVCAVDCGIVINPDQVKSQMESGINYALSAALGEAITLKDGEVEQGNFDSYRVLRMPAAPPIEVYMVESDAAPTGTGEPGVPPLAPALANALFQATGKRLTRLPLSV